jgi:hypothetical protein
MGSLAKRMTKKDIKAALQNLNKKMNTHSPKPDNSHNSPGDDEELSLGTWVEISLKSESLIKQII